MVDDDARDGSSPPDGSRFLLLLDERRSTPHRAVYRGSVERAGRAHAIEVIVDAERTEGQALASADDEARQLAEKAAALVRAVARAPLLEGRRPPRRVHRWRA